MRPLKLYNYYNNDFQNYQKQYLQLIIISDDPVLFLLFVKKNKKFNLIMVD